MEAITEIINGVGSAASSGVGTAAMGLLSAASGGIFGVLGAVTTAIFKGRQKKADRQFQKEQWSHEERLLDKHMEAKNQETENELLIANQNMQAQLATINVQGSWDGMRGSLEAEKEGNKGTSQWVRNTKSLYRPFLTTMLWILVMVELYMVRTGALPINADTLEGDIVRYVTISTVFAASTATAWWFGDRALEPPEVKYR